MKSKMKFFIYIAIIALTLIILRSISTELGLQTLQFVSIQLASGAPAFDLDREAALKAIGYFPQGSQGYVIKAGAFFRG